MPTSGSVHKQDIERQKHVIKTFLNGGKHEVKWYIDEGYSGRLPFEDRPALIHACLKDAVREKDIDEGWSGDLPPAKDSQSINDASSMARGKGHILLSDFSRFSRNIGHSCTFLTDVVKKNKVSLLIADHRCTGRSGDRPANMILKGLAQRAEDYREDNSIKTKQGLQAIKQRLKGSYKAKNGKSL